MCAQMPHSAESWNLTPVFSGLSVTAASLGKALPAPYTEPGGASFLETGTLVTVHAGQGRTNLLSLILAFSAFIKATRGGTGPRFCPV